MKNRIKSCLTFCGGRGAGEEDLGDVQLRDMGSRSLPSLPDVGGRDLADLDGWGTEGSGGRRPEQLGISIAGLGGRAGGARGRGRPRLNLLELELSGRPGVGPGGRDNHAQDGQEEEEDFEDDDLYLEPAENFVRQLNFNGESLVLLSILL